MLAQNNEDLDVSYHPDEQYEDELLELEEQQRAEENSSYGSQEVEDVVDALQGDDCGDQQEE